MYLTKEQQNNTFTKLKDLFGYHNQMEAARLEKIVINVGTGKKSRTNPKVNDLVTTRLAEITGQKPTIRGAKQSIAGFKIRQGNPIGVMVTLRGARMYAFLDKLIHIALPRTKDFRGLKRSSVDEMGNVTLGIKDHTIFPETVDEDVRDVFGMSITVTTTARNKAEATAFFEHIGVPFEKIADKKPR